MKHPDPGACALGCLMLFAFTGAAQDASHNSKWNGSWKADASSMKYDGPSVTVAITPTGYTLTRDGKPTTVVCDGNPNAPVDGTTTSCTKTDTGYTLDNTRNGKPSSHVALALSSDGTTMTRTAKVIPSEGDPYTVTLVSKKVSGDGTSTVWKETGFSESQDTGILSILVKGDSIDFKETDNDKPITCKLDGTPTTLGTRGMSVKMADPHTLKVTYSNDGKVQRENTFVLSGDGQSIQETDVTPAPSASTMSLTLNKD